MSDTDDIMRDADEGRGGEFETLPSDDGPGPQRCIHEEAQEDDVLDAFSDYGEVKNLNVNLDRRTGFLKGYALIEYKEKAEAEAAIDAMDGYKIMGQEITVDWAFVKDNTKPRRRGARR